MYEPLYDYSSGSPVFTYEWLRASTTYEHERWVFDEGDTTPWFITAGGFVLKKAGQQAVGNVVSGAGSIWTVLSIVDGLEVQKATHVSTELVSEYTRLKPYGWHNNPNGMYPPPY